MSGVLPMSAINRALKAAWQELKKPASYVKGDEFERYIRANLFPAVSYVLLHKNHDFYTSQDFDIETSKEPDFRFKSQASGTEFFVEAKYRSQFFRGKLEWCKTYQLRRYQAINKGTPIFIVIGVGKNPLAPEQVYLIPMKEIKYTVLFHSFLRKYKIIVNQCVPEDSLFSNVAGEQEI
jgi:hypothetical protein